MERCYPIKSPNDLKHYVTLVLPNGLKLLLVSDSECDKAAVSVSIGVGSMSDPDNILGLAHLCEHLLSFEKGIPPGHKPFNVFVAENGGSFNAFTSRDQTNFHFDIGPLAFPDALERFTKFFLTVPNFSEDDVQKEISVVDSEFQSKVNKDSWRKMGVDATTAKKDHPFYKFTTGNKKTLWEEPAQKGLNVLKAASAFRSKFYVSRLMAVVVYGKQSLNELENLCVPLWSQVPDKVDAEVPSWTDFPYGKNELKKRIDIVSLADIRDFYVMFPIPNMRPFYKTFPLGYITRLLGNRGPGSLYSVLYEKHWVEYSYINSSVLARGFGELSIGFQLTEQGMQLVDEIVLHVFQYVKMLKDNGPQHYFWKEMQKVLSLQFTYQEKEIPVEFVQRISNLMHVYPLSDVLSVGSLITEYDPTIIENFMEYLDPNNCRVLTVCKENANYGPNFLQDHWYGTKFTVKIFTEEQLQEWKMCQSNKSFYLPKDNKFIPTDFALKEKAIETKESEENHLFSWTPSLLVDTPLCKAWFFQDNLFKTAKGVIRLEIFSPLPMSDPVLFNLNQIWFLILKNALSDEYYQATAAGSYHDIKPTLYGTEITVSGFSDKLIQLMDEIFEKVASSLNTFDLIKIHFNSVKERYANGLKNWKNLPLQNVSTYFLSLLLRERRFSNEELLESLEDSSEKNLVRYMKDFFFRSHFEWMFYGNFLEQESTHLVKSCISLVNQKWKVKALLSCQNVRLREVCIEPGTPHVFQNSCPQSQTISESSSSIFLQCGVLNLRKSLCLEIIDQIIFEPLFTQLRNQEQIGYIIRSSVRKSNECHGLLVYVQGEKSAEFLSEKILLALNSMEDRLINLTEAGFNQHKGSVRIRKSEFPKTMLILFNKLWNNEIFPRRYDFKRISKELCILDQITRSEVVNFFKDYFGKNSTQRRILKVHLTRGSLFNGNSSMQNTITHISKWKLNMKLNQAKAE